MSAETFATVVVTLGVLLIAGLFGAFVYFLLQMFGIVGEAIEAADVEIAKAREELRNG